MKEETLQIERYIKDTQEEIDNIRYEISNLIRELYEYNQQLSNAEELLEDYQHELKTED